MTDYTNVEIDALIQGLADDKKSQFENLSNNVSSQIQNIKQLINDKGSGSGLEEELDHIQAFNPDRTTENRPQLNPAGLSESNKHTPHLSNHELHQMRATMEKDHRKPVRTILDEPLGIILDNTINFLMYSMDNFSKKIYEAELMEQVRGDRGVVDTVKVYAIASILFLRDDRNIIYIGFIMVFLSIIIYFISIITI